MAGGFIGDLSNARVASYREIIAAESGRTPSAIRSESVQSLYIWQASVSSAWYETIALFEPVLRNSIDESLRDWNQRQGRSPDWLEDAPPPLQGLTKKMAEGARQSAERESKKRPASHPRQGHSPTLDDRVSQLSFGNLSSLFPSQPPKNRQNWLRVSRNTKTFGFTG